MSPATTTAGSAVGCSWVFAYLYRQAISVVDVSTSYSPRLLSINSGKSRGDFLYYNFDFLGNLYILTSAMTLTLQAEKRDILGKKLASKRSEGKLPVVIYGRKKKPASFFVDTKEFKKIFHEAGESTIVTLKTADGDKNTLIHDIQFNPLTEEPIHVDFYVVEKDKKVEVPVPIVFTGESSAVKELSAVLVKVMHELEIEALPSDLPHEISIDISVLKAIGDKIHVSDIKMPTGVTSLNDPEEVVALVEEAREEA